MPNARRQRNLNPKKITPHLQIFQYAYIPSLRYLLSNQKEHVIQKKLKADQTQRINMSKIRREREKELYKPCLNFLKPPLAFNPASGLPLLRVSIGTAHRSRSKYKFPLIARQIIQKNT